MRTQGRGGLCSLLPAKIIRHQCGHFLIAERPPEAALGMRSLELAMALYQSARTGSVVKLSLDHRSPLYHGVELPPDGEDGKESEALVCGPTAERSTFRLGNKEQVRT